eukprot:TRINITY_DN7470_c0_g1_i2.p1 TRINITY_DN7470_c0_g1~~TRINITY_DN7470_c0_g1_i2.p1  ORF type:complete len:134 (+),score=63.74 TRINITY_DN7470_c0_g1_i2:204-605(+)
MANIPKLDKDTLEIRQIGGSTAGAGSGEFHTYRGFRNKELARLEKMDKDAKAEEIETAYQKNRLHNDIADKVRTEKKRNKRQRLKELKRKKRNMKKIVTDQEEDSTTDDGEREKKRQKNDGDKEKDDGEKKAE